MDGRLYRAWLSGGAAMGALILSSAAIAADQDPTVTPPPVAKQADGSRSVYLPADFARFTPKTAFDMLTQIPGFVIKGADQARGLGQASENVIINGQRVANKSGGAVDQLARTSASAVVRIEIVDAASLGIAGLSGRVANVIVSNAKGGSGQFEYKPGFRLHYAKPVLFGGSISYTGTAGPIEYTLSANNDYGRGAFGGPIEIFDRDRNLIERRFEVFHSEYDEAALQAKFKLDAPGSAVANLTLGYSPYWKPATVRDRRELVSGEKRRRTNDRTANGYAAEINGDYEFALGPGRFKLIGLHNWEHDPQVTTQILSYETTGQPDTGLRFTRDTRLQETIGRGEYKWKGGANDWQFTVERAFNSLDQKGGLFNLDEDGEFVELPFPEGSGKVTETRYEAIGSWSRSLSPTFDVQVDGGGEISFLDRVDDDQKARKFFRPKGSLTLGWRPEKDWDLSLKFRRRVGQISFYDFLAQPKLDQDRENAGNPDLVPPQSWETEADISHDLGAWGKTALNVHYYRVEDIIDVIPIGKDGEGIGNLPSANRIGFESKSTIQFDPIGIVGAKLDLTIGREWTAVRDPLTGQKRPISGIRDRWASANFRHDIPGSEFAYSWFVAHRRATKDYYLTEIYDSQDLPWIVGFGIQHKNIFGMTGTIDVENVLNGRHLVNRTVYEGYRDRTPVAFYQRQDQLVGPIITLSLKGTF